MNSSVVWWDFAQHLGVARSLASDLDVANRLQQLLANIALGVPCSQFLFTSWHGSFPPRSYQSWPHLRLRAFQHAPSRPSMAGRGAYGRSPLALSRPP